MFYEDTFLIINKDSVYGFSSRLLQIKLRLLQMLVIYSICWRNRIIFSAKVHFFSVIRQVLVKLIHIYITKILQLHNHWIINKKLLDMGLNHNFSSFKFFSGSLPEIQYYNCKQLKHNQIS